VTADAAIYFYDDPELGRLGPFSARDLRRLVLNGAINLETRIVGLGLEDALPVRDVCLRHWPERPPPSTESSAAPPGSIVEPQAPPGPRKESFTERAGDDLRVLLPHLTIPLDELRNFGWLRDRRALAIAAIGLLPLIIYAVFRAPSQVLNAYWAMALYFSSLWALFFYYVFPTPDVRVRLATASFFVTCLVSVSALLLLYTVWPLNQVNLWIRSDNWLIAWMGYVFAVGVPEELCKAFVLFVLLRRFGPIRPQALLFYGLMSGLGFGIYEGVKYQTRENFQFAIWTSGQPDAYFAAEYYLLNLIRLTTLPFLHAIWTGMAGYFIGFADQFPERRRGLLLVAVGLPALLHGTYNTFGGGAGMFIALISVLALNLYLAKSVEFERLLRTRP
jgi:protease PrsW